MKSCFQTILILVMLLSCTTAATMKADDTNDTAIANLRESLSRTIFGSDSIRILNNIFDLTVTNKRYDVGREIIECAERNGDRETTLDVIRRLATFGSSNVSFLDSMQRLTHSLEPSDDRDATAAFIGMLQNSMTIKTVDDSTKVKYIHNLIKDFNENPPADVYDRIVKLHAICLFLADSSQDELLENYTDHLSKLVESLPKNAYAIRNSHYVQAALNYARTGNLKKSIDADKKLLNIINQLEFKYKNSERNFINYDANLFVIYTRLLSNYPALTPEEVEEYYGKVMELVERDYRAKSTFTQQPYARIYHDMATENYTDALSLIKKLLPDEKVSWRRRALIKMMMTAAEKTGKDDDLLTALKEYTRMNEQFMAERLDKSYKEMQITYNIYDLEERLNDLNEAKTDSEHKLTSRFVTMLIISAILLVVALVILFILYHHSRSLARRLRRSNDELTAERDKLRTQSLALDETRREADNATRMRVGFIKNLSNEIGPSLRTISEYSQMLIDFADDSDKEFLANFVNVIKLNCELLRTLADDILTLSDIEGTSLSLNPVPTDLNEVISTAIQAANANDKKDLEINFVSTVDHEIVSDPQRIEQILIYLLSNAIKFTDDGAITIKCDANSKNVTISVTDSGMGIEPKYREKIFDRFFQANKSTPGAGLGLHIARQLARLLGGDLKLDSSYTFGARFILTLPVSSPAS